jgi:hypothetical protein
MWVANRWLAIRVDFVGSLVTFCSAFSLILFTQYYKKIDPGIAGLSLSYALTFTDGLLWMVRMHALMDMEMNAVERVEEYSEIEQEFPAVNPAYRPAQNVKRFI